MPSFSEVNQISLQSTDWVMCFKSYWEMSTAQDNTREKPKMPGFGLPAYRGLTGDVGTKDEGAPNSCVMWANHSISLNRSFIADQIKVIRSTCMSHQARVKIELHPKRDKEKGKHLCCGPAPMLVLPAYCCSWIKAFILSPAAWQHHFRRFCKDCRPSPITDNEITTSTGPSHSPLIF